MDKLRGERCELIAPPRGVASREVYVLALMPTQLTQPFPDCGHAAGAEFWREETQQPKPGNLPRLLRLGDERRGDDTGH